MRRSIDCAAIYKSISFTIIATTLLGISDLYASDIKLADIVGGGNGISGGTAGHGIDPSTGGTTPPMFFQISQADNTNSFHLSSVTLVNGVFIPDGGAGAVTLDSAAHSFSGFPNTDSNSWDIIKYGPNQNSGSILSGVNYDNAPHSLIGMHANKGITFDLHQVAAANPGMSTTSFSAVVGMTHIAGGYGTADWWIFVDGVLKQNQTNAPGGVGSAVNIHLNSTDRFLTLVTTDAGDGFNVDQIIFGDPVLHLQAIPESSSATLVITGFACLAGYVRRRNKTG